MAITRDAEPFHITLKMVFIIFPRGLLERVRDLQPQILMFLKPTLKADKQATLTAHLWLWMIQVKKPPPTPIAGVADQVLSALAHTWSALEDANQ